MFFPYFLKESPLFVILSTHIPEQHAELEKLNESLLDDAARKEYQTPLDIYRPDLLPRMLGGGCSCFAGT